MTNEEAITILRRAVAEVEWEYPMEIAAAIDKAIEALGGGWSSVKDRLPESSCMVFCFDGFHNFYVTEYSAKHKKFNANDTEGGDFYALETITHWMPIPEPPKEENHG